MNVRILVPLDGVRVSRPAERARLLLSDRMVASTAARILINAAGTSSVVGVYQPRDPSTIPAGFALVCRQQGWGTQSM